MIVYKIMEINNCYYNNLLVATFEDIKKSNDTLFMYFIKDNEENKELPDFSHVKTNEEIYHILKRNDYDFLEVKT